LFVTDNLKLLDLSEEESISLHELYRADHGTIRYIPKGHKGRHGETYWVNEELGRDEGITDYIINSLKEKRLIEGSVHRFGVPGLKNIFSLDEHLHYQVKPTYSRLVLSLRENRLGEIGYHLKVIMYFNSARIDKIWPHIRDYEHPSVDVCAMIIQVIKIGVLSC